MKSQLERSVREMDKLLRGSGVPFEKVNYYVKPLTKKKLNERL
ncbi:MAG TPA: hypothetical protein VF899_21250 [Pyrinomonadaceae bacterium]